MRVEWRNKKKEPISAHASIPEESLRPFLILRPRTCNPLSALSYIVCGRFVLSVVHYYTAEAGNIWKMQSRTTKYKNNPKRLVKKKLKCVLMSDKLSCKKKKVQLRDISSSSSSLFPNTLETSLWTEQMQLLKVWQHLKLTPHAASDFSSADLTFQTPASVQGMRRGRAGERKCGGLTRKRGREDEEVRQW